MDNKEATSNPIGQFKFRPATTAVIQPPAADVAAKQDPDHSEDDFARDLDKATGKKPAAS